MDTGKKEYINMTVSERLQLENNAQTMEDIKHSLERTNHEEYRALLKKYGQKFYPISDEDEQHFAGIERFSKCKPTAETTASLYNLGIFIEETVKDEKTGKTKQEILDDSQKQFKQTNKMILLSILTGFVAFFLFGVTFSIIGLAEISFFLAFLLGTGSAAAVAFVLDRYYKSKGPTISEQQKNPEERKKADQDVQNNKQTK